MFGAGRGGAGVVGVAVALKSGCGWKTTGAVGGVIGGVFKTGCGW